MVYKQVVDKVFRRGTPGLESLENGEASVSASSPADALADGKRERFVDDSNGGCGACMLIISVARK